MRIEANVSVSGNEHFGVKVEVKNLNSFKIVEKAIDYEIKRQIKVIEDGGKIIQETRGWDEAKQKTFSQRLKEGSEDYRYFPDPDLPKLKISEIEEFKIENLKKEISELPWKKRERYSSDYGIKFEDIETYIIDNEYGDFFEKVVDELSGEKDLIKLASNYITSDIVGLKKDFLNSTNEQSELNSFGKIETVAFAELIKMIREGKLFSRSAKDILKIMFIEGGNPKEIAEKNNLFQKNDEGELKKVILKIIKENKQVVEDYKSGKETALKFLIGKE